MLNIDFLQKAYFAFDEPVPYTINDKVIEITPIKLKDSEIFLASIIIFQHDKNSSPSVEIIQMSYLQYMIEVLMPHDEVFIDKMANVLHLCFGIDDWKVVKNDKGKYVLIDRTHDIELTSKKLEELVRIACYQNILHYDDAYVNPEFKKMMEKVDSVKNFNREFPSIERRMYIIEAHTGITKQEQKTMTFREHQGLFEEVVGEVEFNTTRAISLYAGKEVPHWVYPPKKQKYDGYMTSMGKYKQSFGGSANISDNVSTDGNSQVEQFLNKNYQGGNLNG